MLYIDKEGRPYSRNICFVHIGGIKHPGGSLEQAFDSGQDLIDIAVEVATGGTINGGSGNNADDYQPEAQTEDVADVEDREEFGDQLNPKQGTNVSIPVIYGNRMIGGTLVYQEVEEDGTGTELLNLYQCWAICEGVVQTWDLYVDDVKLQDSIYWRGSGTGYSDKLIWTNGYNGDSSSWAYGTSFGSNAGIAEPAWSLGADHLGQIPRASGSSWRASDSGATHKMKGIACEQISYRHHWNTFIHNIGSQNVTFEGFGPDGTDATNTEGLDVWKGGMPKLGFDVEGLEIVNNAGGTESYTDPAWILYDYLTNTRYGCSLPANEIDTTSFATASAICEETTTGGVAHSGIPRHSCNIILDTKQPVITNIKRILATCNGRLHWINGLYTMKIDDAYSGSGVFNFLEKHIIGGISITGESTGQRLNQVTAKFINPAKKWKFDEVRYPDINNESSVYTSFLADDNNVKHHKTINVGGVTNLNQARYLAKQACLRSRNTLKTSFRTTAEAMNVIVGDVIAVTHSTPQWTAKQFIVRSISLNKDGSCSISCIEHNNAIYAWETVGVPASAANTTLPDITVVTAPTGMIMIPASYQSIASAGTRISVQLDWTSLGAFTNSHDVQYKLSSVTAWTDAGSTISKSMLLQDFATGTFDFRVRAKNAVGSISAWHTITNQEVVSQLLVPENVSNFDVNINSADANTVVATWDAPSDADLKAGGHIEIRNLMSGASDWEEAEVLATVGGSSTSVLLPLMEGNYIAKWIGSDGLEALIFQESGLGTVFWTNTTDFVDYHTEFAGTKTNLYVADNDGAKILKFVSEGNWDDFIALDSITTMIDEHGGTATEGIYISEPHDLEKVFKMRLYTKKVFTSGVSDGSNYMDTWGTVDARNSWDEVSRLAGVTSYIRTTVDDPASPSAGWTAYKKFQVADVQARGVQLKVQFESDLDGAEQFRMTQLSLLFDMKSKVFGENALSTATVTYTETFHQKPILLVTPKNMVSGDYMTISNETSSGFGINFFNSSGVGVTRDYNYLAEGVG